MTTSFVLCVTPQMNDEKACTIGAATFTRQSTPYNGMSHSKYESSLAYRQYLMNAIMKDCAALQGRLLMPSQQCGPRKQIRDKRQQTLSKLPHPHHCYSVQPTIFYCQGRYRVIIYGVDVVVGCCYYMVSKPPLLCMISRQRIAGTFWCI